MPANRHSNHRSTRDAYLFVNTQRSIQLLPHSLRINRALPSYAKLLDGDDVFGDQSAFAGTELAKKHQFDHVVLPDSIIRYGKSGILLYAAAKKTYFGKNYNAGPSLASQDQQKTDLHHFIVTALVSRITQITHLSWKRRRQCAPANSSQNSWP